MDSITSLKRTTLNLNEALKPYRVTSNLIFELEKSWDFIVDFTKFTWLFVKQHILCYIASYSIFTFVSLWSRIFRRFSISIVVAVQLLDRFNNLYVRNETNNESSTGHYPNKMSSLLGLQHLYADFFEAMRNSGFSMLSRDWRIKSLLCNLKLAIFTLYNSNNLQAISKRLLDILK